MLAVLSGDSADRSILASGMIGEEEFYRALARELDAPFIQTPILSGKASYPNSVLAGIAPTESGYVAAPRGRQIIALLQRRFHAEGLGITTPRALMQAVFKRQGRVIAYQAAHHLEKVLPCFSSREGPTWNQTAALAALSLGLSFLLVSRFSLGLAAIASLLSPLFLGMVGIRLACTFLSRARMRQPLLNADDASLPVYTVIAALYREKEIARRLVAALSRLDYPAAKLDVKLVVEEDDHETQALLGQIDLPGFMDIIVAPPGFPRTKPRALNIALPLALGECVVVYDAEDIPDRDQLRFAAGIFAQNGPDVACLQARLTIGNIRESILSRLFAIEYAALFDVINPGLAEIGCPIPLGGTSNHFRTDALRIAGGWDAWNVTEDADLGIRLARLGYRVKDLPSWTREEAPAGFLNWHRQRTRWMKGFIQTCISHSRSPWATLRELGAGRFVGALIVSAGTVLSALGYPFFLGLCLFGWTNGYGDDPNLWDLFWRRESMTLFIFGTMAMFIPAWTALVRRKMGSLIPWTIFLPVYYLLVSLAAWRSLWELAYAPFYWHKTDHGFAPDILQHPD